MAALVFAPSFHYFLARERHFYTLFKRVFGRGSKAWEWGLIHRKARVKLRGGVPLGTARTRFCCLRDNDKVVSEHLLDIPRRVYTPELDSVLKHGSTLFRSVSNLI